MTPPDPDDPEATPEAHLGAHPGALTASGLDPAPPDAALGAPRPLLRPAFWAMLFLAALCIGAGGVLGLDGARLFPKPRTDHPSNAIRPPVPRRLGDPRPIGH